MTLAELADRMWKKEHGDKTYEQVEAEYAARREKELALICQDLPYRPAECEQNPGFKPMTSDEWRQYLSETWDKTERQP